jgi:serine/threonine protein kinase
MDDVQKLKIKVKEVLNTGISDSLSSISEEESVMSSYIGNSIRQSGPNEDYRQFGASYSQDLEEKEDCKDDIFTLIDAKNNPRITRSFDTIKIAKELREYQLITNMLWEAIENNDIDKVKKLLYPEPDAAPTPLVNYTGLNKWTALHIVSAQGTINICELLVLIDGVNLNARTSMNRTPLHLACIHNHYKVVVLLVKSGAKVDLVDNDNNTPLHYASSLGYDDIVEYLLKKNANILIKNNYLRTPMDVSLDYSTYIIFIEYCKVKNIQVYDTGYNRTIFSQTLIHNSREDTINKILLKSKITPNTNDLKLFIDRAKFEHSPIKKSPKKKFVFDIPASKVTLYDFDYICRLGKGSFGKVYLGQCKNTKNYYGIKVLDKDIIIGRSLEKYAFTERNVLMNITHPFIVKLHYSFQTPEKLVLVMDYCSNGDLGSALQRERWFTEEKARFYTVEILLALQELHSHNIAFRDLKPENILINSDGHIKLTDFGLSKEGVEYGDLTKSFCGSAAYFAPEMVLRQGHTKSIDWYVLGVLLYEMLTGTTPFYSSDRNILFKRVAQGKVNFSKKVSKDAQSLILSLMNKNPQERLGASKEDAEEIKSHSFFDGVDWTKYLCKEITPPPFKTVTRNLKSISIKEIFGNLEEPESGHKIDGWSIYVK